ncbi:uncharacterized protein DFL_007249 [Arthrobotrys flagrans]|uniref:Pal1 cell morphology protein n=1 Tax=Arthrobotrys flagrans TaxID=97331 RepID=A0A436ZV56_ARTFL|nr:hypothetical protein DFL_007249 [Arthrobotrys flagrans]
MAWGGTTPPRKEGDNSWAQEYLLDPLNAVEAYQTAQTGGQYNNRIPTQHKTLTVEQYLAAGSKPTESGSSGITRSRSLLSRSGSKRDKKQNKHEATEPQDAAPAGQVRRTTSIRDKLIRRFTDDGKDPDRRQRPLRPLNEVSDKEISRMGNTVSPRGPRLLAPVPVPEKVPDVQNRQDNNDLQNQENRPVSKRVEDRWSNNPYRDALVDAENRGNRENIAPPGSPNANRRTPLSPTNPFRRVGEGSSLPVQCPPRPHTRTPQPRGSMHRSDGPRTPVKPHSRLEVKPRSGAQRVPVADTIDSLDTSFGIFTFHHEGPYDATLSHRNRNPLKSPVHATRYGNAMALRATAPEDIQNSIQFGRPLDGVAAFPPGTHVTGGVLEYEEYDVNRKDGNFRRYPGERYRDEDLKGKGIEGYDGDLAAKKEKEAKHRRGKSLDTATGKFGGTLTSLDPVASSVYRNGSTAGRLEGAAAKFKRTFSIKRKEKKTDDV